ncbi:hypothetical protein [Streptomyces longwoodensis]|uniref:hypothetical protein n=1 Tax=Streptomyces longwoodensis TaxID=68231 RepID=UPI0038103231
MTADLSRLDVPLADVQAEIAANRLRIRMNHLDELLAHPELAAMGRKATAGELAEMRHLLYDADPDATVPAFPYPTTTEVAR